MSQKYKNLGDLLKANKEEMKIPAVSDQSKIVKASKPSTTVPSTPTTTAPVSDKAVDGIFTPSKVEAPDTEVELPKTTTERNFGHVNPAITFTTPEEAAKKNETAAQIIKNVPASMAQRTEDIAQFTKNYKSVFGNFLAGKVNDMNQAAQDAKGESGKGSGGHTNPVVRLTANTEDYTGRSKEFKTKAIEATEKALADEQKSSVLPESLMKWTEEVRKGNESLGDTEKYFAELAYSIGGSAATALMATGANAAVTAAATAITGNPVTGAAAGKYASKLVQDYDMFSSVFTSQYRNLVQNDYDPEVAFENAFRKAVVETASEAAFNGIPGTKSEGWLDTPIEAVTSKVASSSFAKELVSTVGANKAGSALVSAVETVVRFLDTPLGKFIKNANEEGLEEVYSTWREPIIDRATIDPNADDATLKEYASSYAGGVLSSLIMETVPAVFKSAATGGRCELHLDSEGHLVATRPAAVVSQNIAGPDAAETVAENEEVLYLPLDEETLQLVAPYIPAMLPAPGADNTVGSDGVIYGTGPISDQTVNRKDPIKRTPVSIQRSSDGQTTKGFELNGSYYYEDGSPAAKGDTITRGGETIVNTTPATSSVATPDAITDTTSAAGTVFTPKATIQTQSKAQAQSTATQSKAQAQSTTQSTPALSQYQAATLASVVLMKKLAFEGLNQSDIAMLNKIVGTVSSDVETLRQSYPEDRTSLPDIRIQLAPDKMLQWSPTLTFEDIAEYYNSQIVPAINETVAYNNMSANDKFYQNYAENHYALSEVAATDIPASFVAKYKEHIGSNQTDAEVAQDLADMLNSQLEGMTPEAWNELLASRVDGRAMFQRIFDTQGADAARALYGDKAVDAYLDYLSMQSGRASGFARVIDPETNKPRLVNYDQFKQMFGGKYTNQSDEEIRLVFQSLKEREMADVAEYLNDINEQASRFGITILAPKSMDEYKSDTYSILRDKSQLGHVDFGKTTAGDSTAEIKLNTAKLKSREAAAEILAHEVVHSVTSRGDSKKFNTLVAEMMNNIGLNYDRWYAEVTKIGYKPGTVAQAEVATRFLGYALGNSTVLSALGTADPGSLKGISAFIEAATKDLNNSFTRTVNQIKTNVDMAVDGTLEQKTEAADKVLGRPQPERVAVNADTNVATESIPMKATSPVLEGFTLRAVSMQDGGAVVTRVEAVAPEGFKNWSRAAKALKAEGFTGTKKGDTYHWYLKGGNAEAQAYWESKNGPSLSTASTKTEPTVSPSAKASAEEAKAAAENTDGDAAVEAAVAQARAAAPTGMTLDEESIGAPKKPRVRVQPVVTEYYDVDVRAFPELAGWRVDYDTANACLEVSRPRGVKLTKEQLKAAAERLKALGFGEVRIDPDAKEGVESTKDYRAMVPTGIWRSYGSPTQSLTNSDKFLALTGIPLSHDILTKTHERLSSTADGPTVREQEDAWQERYGVGKDGQDVTAKMPGMPSVTLIRGTTSRSKNGVPTQVVYAVPTDRTRNKFNATEKEYLSSYGFDFAKDNNSGYKYAYVHYYDTHFWTSAVDGDLSSYSNLNTLKVNLAEYEGWLGRDFANMAYYDNNGKLGSGYIVLKPTRRLTEDERNFILRTDFSGNTVEGYQKFKFRHDNKLIPGVMTYYIPYSPELWYDFMGPEGMSVEVLRRNNDIAANSPKVRASRGWIATSASSETLLKQAGARFIDTTAKSGPFAGAKVLRNRYTRNYVYKTSLDSKTGEEVVMRRELSTPAKHDELVFIKDFGSDRGGMFRETYDGRDIIWVKAKDSDTTYTTTVAYSDSMWNTAMDPDQYKGQIHYDTYRGVIKFRTAPGGPVYTMPDTSDNWALLTGRTTMDEIFQPKGRPNVVRQSMLDREDSARNNTFKSNEPYQVEYEDDLGRYTDNVKASDIAEVMSDPSAVVITDRNTGKVIVDKSKNFYDNDVLSRLSMEQKILDAGEMIRGKDEKLVIYRKSVKGETYAREELFDLYRADKDVTKMLYSDLSNPESDAVIYDPVNGIDGNEFSAKVAAAAAKLYGGEEGWVTSSIEYQNKRNKEKDIDPSAVRSASGLSGIFTTGGTISDDNYNSTEAKNAPKTAQSRDEALDAILNASPISEADAENMYSGITEADLSAAAQSTASEETGNVSAQCYAIKTKGKCPVLDLGVARVLTKPKKQYEIRINLDGISEELSLPANERSARLAKLTEADVKAARDWLKRANFTETSPNIWTAAYKSDSARTFLGLPSFAGMDVEEAARIATLDAAVERGEYTKVPRQYVDPSSGKTVNTFDYFPTGKNLRFYKPGVAEEYNTISEEDAKGYIAAIKQRISDLYGSFGTQATRETPEAHKTTKQERARAEAWRKRLKAKDPKNAWLDSVSDEDAVRLSNAVSDDLDARIAYVKSFEDVLTNVSLNYLRLDLEPITQFLFLSGYNNKLSPDGMDSKTLLRAVESAGYPLIDKYDSSKKIRIEPSKGFTLEGLRSEGESKAKALKDAKAAVDSAAKTAAKNFEEKFDEYWGSIVRSGYADNSLPFLEWATDAFLTEATVNASRELAYDLQKQEAENEFLAEAIQSRTPEARAAAEAKARAQREAERETAKQTTPIPWGSMRAVDTDGMQLSPEQTLFLKDSVGGRQPGTGQVIKMYSNAANGRIEKEYLGDVWGDGIYLTREPALGSVSNAEVYANITNPLYVEDAGSADFRLIPASDAERVLKVLARVNKNLAGESVSLPSNLLSDIKSGGKVPYGALITNYAEKAMAKQAEHTGVFISQVAYQLGFDGICSKNDFMVFEPDQLIFADDIYATMKSNAMAYTADDIDDMLSNMASAVSGRKTAPTYAQTSQDNAGMNLDENFKFFDDMRTSKSRTVGNQWAAKGREFGTMEARTNNYRSATTPKAIDEQSKLSRTIQTFMQDDNMSPESVQLLKRQVLELGVGSYVPIKLRKLVDTATQNVAKFADLSDAFNDWKATVDNSEGVLTSPSMVAYSYVLIRDMQARIREIDAAGGNAMPYVYAIGEIQKTVQLSGTPTAQLLASYNLFRVLSGKSALDYAHKLVNAYNKAEGLSIEVPAEIEAMFSNAQTQDDTEAAADALAKYVAKETPRNFKRWSRAWRFFCMLFNPVTHVRNIGSNAIQLVNVATKNRLAGAMEDRRADVFTAKGQERTKTAKGLNSAEAKALRAFAKSDYKNIESWITGSGGRYSTSTSEFFNTVSKYRKDLFLLNGLSNLNSAALEAEDGWFLKYHYNTALAQYCLTKNLTVEYLTDKANVEALNAARAYAVNEAQKATYRDANAIAQAISELQTKINKATSTKKAKQEGRNNGVVGDMTVGAVMPFTKVPMNVGARGILEYSPVGLVRGVGQYIQSVQADASQGDMAQAIDLMCAGLAGTSTFLLGMLLGGLGILTGGGSDDDRKNRFEGLLGRKDYSIVFPSGATYTIDWATPSSIPLFAGVALQRSLAESKAADDETIDVKDVANGLLSAARGLVDPIVEMSFMQGVDDLLNNVRYGDDSTKAVIKAMGSMAQSYAGQFVPVIGTRVKNMVDPTVSSTYAPADSDFIGGSQVERGVRSLANRAPNIASVFGIENAPVYDVMGNKRTNDQGSTLKNVAYNLASPGYYTPNKSAEVEQWLNSLSLTQGSDVLPSTASKYFEFKQDDGTKKKVILDNTEYSEAQKLEGSTNYSVLKSVHDSDLLTGLSDDVVGEIVSEVLQYSKKVSKDTYAINNGIAYDADSILEKVKKAQDTGLPIGEYFIIAKVLSDFDNVNAAGEKETGLASERKRRYCRSIGLSLKQAEVFGVNYY